MVFRFCVTLTETTPSSVTLEYEDTFKVPPDLHTCKCTCNTMILSEKNMRKFEPSGCLLPNVRILNLTPNDIPNIFLIYAQNIDCGYTTTTDNLCFGEKIRQVSQFCYIKVGSLGYTLHGHVPSEPPKRVSDGVPVYQKLKGVSGKKSKENG